MCLHMSGLNVEWCSVCTPPVIKKIEKEVDPLEKEYKDKESLFKGRLDVWTKGEIELVYDEFKSISKKKDFRRKVYEVSIVLERTQLAVRWMIKHVFSKREDLHRGNEVIKFREEIVNGNKS